MTAGGAEEEPPAVALARVARARGIEAVAAHDPRTARLWLERAHRLVPRDANAMLALASVCLADDPRRAAALFQSVTEQYDVGQAWLGLAAARLRLAGPAAAAEALSAALSRHAFSPESAGIADAIALGSGSAGWCALRSDGRIEIAAAALNRVRISLDGKLLAGTGLPAGWHRGRIIDVRANGVSLLGSPLQIAAIRRLDGYVELADDGVRGWAWHPADPENSPTLTLVGSGGCLLRTITPTDESTLVPDLSPLARPRSFHFTRAQLPDVPGPISIRGPDGYDLPGSPLYLRAPAGGSAAANPDPAVGSPVGSDGCKRPVIVVIHVRDGGQPGLACLAGVLATLPATARLLVVDDGSSDPVLLATLDDLRKDRKLQLIRHKRALGFAASANAAILASRGRDVVLLKSDAIVPPGWLERLQPAACSCRDIGTVTPLSNDAGILSYRSDDRRMDQAAVNLLDRLAQRANRGTILDIPVDGGVCLYLRRDSLNAVGLFRNDLFAQGDGAEIDFCLRASRLGWRNVALTGLFIGRHGSTSLADGAGHLRSRNARIIERLHPGHDALVAGFLAADSLAPSRRRIDLLAWRARAPHWRGAAVLITHNDGGGIERRVALAVTAHAEAKRRPIVLRPAKTAAGEPAIAVHDAAADDLPNLVYAMPRELPAVLRLLRAAMAETTEVHHLAFYHPAIYRLIARLGIPHEVHIHDYAWFCPRISLVGAQERYCGEPDLPSCETCVADNGHFLQETISVAALRERSAGLLSAARRVIVPSDDTGTRLRRYFAGLPTVTVRHEDDAPIRRRAAAAIAADRPATVCVVGAIGVHKGFNILLACAENAVRRGLDLNFTVVGHTVDDAALMATGRVFVTGYFEPHEAVGLIEAQYAGLGFVPSIWPETWCLSLSDIWRAGLRVAAFDIGAPAERIRRAGGGFLLPLGLAPAAINDALIAAMHNAA